MAAGGNCLTTQGTIGTNRMDRIKDKVKSVSAVDGGVNLSFESCDIFIPNEQRKVRTAFFTGSGVVVLFDSESPTNIEAFDIRGNRVWILPQAEDNLQVPYFDLWVNKKGALLCSVHYHPFPDIDINWPFSVSYEIDIQKGIKKRLPFSK